MQQATWGLDRSPSPFRSYFALDPDVRCLNHGMLGACPVMVLQRQAELRARMERQPAAFVLRELPLLLDEARQALCEVIGADPEDLALVPNVTTALSAVLRSRVFVPGDEILTTDHAYSVLCQSAGFDCAFHRGGGGGGQGTGACQSSR
ncbi:hypothetical protein ACDJ03_04585 [Xanthomonas axonopodis pv. nakataecorchori]|uniref:hypothetical protein n=1 Tax=Xanthomonas axonopodis TaxID=53413 RepID=UPI0035306669